MSNAMVSVLIDDKLSSELIKKGQKQVKKYSWKKTAKETLAIYDKALLK